MIKSTDDKTDIKKKRTFHSVCGNILSPVFNAAAVVGFLSIAPIQHYIQNFYPESIETAVEDVNIEVDDFFALSGAGHYKRGVHEWHKIFAEYEGDWNAIRKAVLGGNLDVMRIFKSVLHTQMAVRAGSVEAWHLLNAINENAPEAYEYANRVDILKNMFFLERVAQVVHNRSYVGVSNIEFLLSIARQVPEDIYQEAGFKTNEYDNPDDAQYFIGRSLEVARTRGEAPDDVMAGWLNSALKHLDPHSRYVPPQNIANDQVGITGQFGGVGIEIRFDDDAGYVRVEKLANMPGGSPAARAGIKVGDYITYVDGEPIENVDEVLRLLRGEVGAEATVTILRDGENEPIDITIKREVITLTAVEVEILPGNIARISLSNFTQQAEPQMRSAIEALEGSDNPPSSYILDLRFNPGGLLPQARAVTNLFLEEGSIVAVRSQHGEYELSAGAGDIINGKDLAVLINSTSASASEIVAGALQLHDRATIIGNRSFGKGSVQSGFHLDFDEDDIAIMRLTTALYFIGGEFSPQGQGVTPDIRVNFGRAMAIEQARRNEADYDRSIISQILDDQAPIPSDNLACLETGRLPDDITQFAEQYQISLNNGETQIDSTLLCATEFLGGTLGAESYTQIRTDIPPTPAPHP